MERIVTGHSQVMPETSGGNSSEITINMGDFARKLRILQKTRKWSTVELGRQIGVSDKTARLWVLERSEPTMSRRKGLHAKVDELLAASDPEPTPEPVPAPESPPEAPPSNAADDLDPEPKPVVRPLLPTDNRWVI